MRQFRRLHQNSAPEILELRSPHVSAFFSRNTRQPYRFYQTWFGNGAIAKYVPFFLATFCLFSFCVRTGKMLSCMVPLSSPSLPLLSSSSSGRPRIARRRCSLSTEPCAWQHSRLATSQQLSLTAGPCAMRRWSAAGPPAALWQFLLAAGPCTTWQQSSFTAGATSSRIVPVLEAQTPPASEARTSPGSEAQMSLASEAQTSSASEARTSLALEARTSPAPEAWMSLALEVQTSPASEARLSPASE